MKTTITFDFKNLAKTVAASLLMFVGASSQAQTPAASFKGGSTYWIDGSGVDVTLPKDTFVNFNGAHLLDSSFTNTTGLITALNNQGVDPTTLGTITIILASTYTGIENGTINIGRTSTGGIPFMSIQRPIVIKPVSGTNFNITSSTAITTTNSLVRFNGAQFVTIDGEGTIGQRNITFSMPTGSTSTSAKVIEMNAFANVGCQLITIQNCRIVGNSTSGSTAVINTFSGIYSGGSSPTPSVPLRQSNAISIINNSIEAVQNPIYIRGIETQRNRQDIGLIVRNNILGGDIQPVLGQTLPTTFIGGNAGAGITLISQRNSTVENNIIRNNIPSGGNFRAIALATVSGVLSVDSNININANRIYNLRSSIAAGVYGIRINLGLHVQPLKLSITNNTISNLFTTTGSTSLTTPTYAIGIIVEDNSVNVGLNILHNSVQLFGDTLNAGSFSACIYTASTTRGGINIGNNILVNRMGRSLNSTGSTATGYIFVIASNTTVPYRFIGPNSYFANNTTGSYSFTGFFRSNRHSIDNWKLILPADQASFNSIPPFNDDSTLTILNNAATRLGDAGTALLEPGSPPINYSLTNDILGNSRSATTPSIGAYEFVGNSATANYPLQGGGNYLINGITAWPQGAASSGSFATLSEASTYLNTYGVSGFGNINIEFNSGYTNETRIVPAFLNYTGDSVIRPVIFKVASGNNFTITTPPTIVANINNQFALINMIGARWITFDGEANVGERNLTFALPATLTSTNLKVVQIGTADSSVTNNITIKNCNIIGASSTTAIFTAMGIYQGHFNPSGAFQNSLVGNNNNINIINNYIQAVRTGIHIRGVNANNQQNRNFQINKNVIGGTVKRGDGLPLTLIGGAADQAGIYLKNVANATLDSNVIRNCDSSLALSNGFRGIDLDAANENFAADSNITIYRNTIYNLVTATGSNCVGIRMNLASNGNRRVRMINNAIAKIRGVGSSASPSTANPSGILIDGSGTINNLGLEMYHNTVQLNGVSLTGSNWSYCAFFGAAIKGGVRLQNNILNNRLGRSTAPNGIAYAMFTNNSGTSLPFTLVSGGLINGNSYGADAPATPNNFVVGTATANYEFLRQWQLIIGQDNNSFNLDAVFQNDTSPVLNPAFSSPLYNGCVAITNIPRDIANVLRSTPLTCVGALEFTLTFLPLAGNQTYNINGVNNFPSTTNTAPFSFATINSAFNYINANGVDAVSANVQRINLVITTGYVGEGDTLITPLRHYPRMNSSRIIVLKSDAGRNDTIRTGNSATYLANGSVLRFNGATNFEIDGSNNGTNSRNLTIALPSGANVQTLKLIDITAGELPSTNIRIKNCNLIGNSSGSTINTYAGIYMGGVTATPSSPIFARNDNNIFENNFIGGVRYGVYAQGVINARGQQDRGLIVRQNVIGGETLLPNTNYFGGFAASAGVYINAQSNVSIDSNLIQNNIPGFANNRGVEVSSTTGALSVDSNVRVSRNRISRIRNTTAAGGAYGVFISYPYNNAADTALAKVTKSITVVNNMISAISAPGTVPSPVTSFSNLSPIGIYVEANSPVTNMGLNIFYNSINLGIGTQVSVNNGVSSCVAFSSNIRSGVNLRNNILQNRLGKSSGTGSAFSIMAGHTSNIFTVCDNNSYFPNASGVTNGIAVFSASTATPVRFNTLPEYTVFTRQDSMSINFVAKFVNDTNLLLDGFQHLVYGWGSPISTVTNDIDNNPRLSFQSTIGAYEPPLGSYADSIAPRIFNITTLPRFCNNGPFPIRYRVFERPTSVSSDTLYYKINEGPEQFIVGGTSGTSVNGFTRTYTIPAQPANTSIAYRLALTDNSPQAFRSVNPLVGYNYTSSTFDQFPITYGFDLPNFNGFSVESQGPGGAGTFAEGGWDLNTFGSPLNPVVVPRTGIKAALFPAFTLPAGTLSRIISPCLDFTNLKVPTLRLWVSQNGEALNRNDLVRVTVTAGFGFSSPLAVVSRPNPDLAFAEFKQLDVCLGNFVGASGFRIAIEGLSAGGLNIVLDSIVIFDDIINQPVTPIVQTVCERDILSLNIPNATANYDFTMVDATTGFDLGEPKTGTGNPLTITALNPNNPFVGRVDSVYTVIRYQNNNAPTCFSYFSDTATVYIKVFHTGPFLVKGVPFNGAFNDGTISRPDGAKIGDSLLYQFVPPSELTNADYGTKWTILNNSINTISGTPITNSVFTPPTPSTNGSFLIRPIINDVDSLFKLVTTIRFIPSNCDSTITRYIKVTSAPSTSFTSVTDSVCPGSPIYFTNTTTGLPNTLPLSYFWDFGDGTSSTTRDGNKTYSFTAAPGLYTVKLTAVNNAGVMSSATKQIRLLEAPVSSFTNGLACGSDSISFTNNSANAVSYLWTSNLNNQVISTSTVANPKFSFAYADTLYTVTLRATNTLGCIKDTARGVFSFSKPVTSFTVANHCLGKTATFVNNTTIIPGSGGRSNTFGSEWDFGNGQIGLSNNPTYTFPANGTFTVRLKATSNYGCVDSSFKTVTVYDKPRAGFNAGLACQNEIVSLTNTTTHSGGIGTVKFNWNFGDFSENSNLANPEKAFTAIGTFNIKLVVNDTVNNCFDSITKVIEVNEKPFALFATTKGCVNTDLTFRNGSIPPVAQTLTFNWNFGDGGSSNDIDPTHKFLTAGDKSVLLTATTNRGCSDTISKIVQVDNVPNIFFTSEHLGTNTVQFTPSNPNFLGYRWDFGDGTTRNANGNPVSNTYQNKDTFDVTLTVTTANGCQASFTDTTIILFTVGLNEAFENKFNISLFPNPFEKVSNVSYNLDSKQNVSITVIDMLGRKVSEVIENNQSAGNHTIVLDESKFTSTSALYMVHIQIGSEMTTKQLLHK